MAVIELAGIREECGLVRENERPVLTDFTQGTLTHPQYLRSAMPP